jgi:HEPN domain-containing protein
MEHDFVADWFRFADMDLSSAEFLLGKRPQPLEIICFLCQQSAEKHLKGYLIYKGVTEPPKTHDLIFLNSKCTEIEPRFCEIDKACGALNLYAVQPRYPNELEIHENDMTKALEYARQIRDFELFMAARNGIEQAE